MVFICFYERSVNVLLSFFSLLDKWTVSKTCREKRQHISLMS